MSLFVDTTAFYALLDADDAYHETAAAAWLEALAQGEQFVTSNYTVVECWALLQRRIGLESVRVFQEEIMPVVHIHWVNQDLHELVVRTVLAAGRRTVSLVDRVSFEVMRQHGILTAFTLDQHFTAEGFTVLPRL